MRSGQPLDDTDRWPWLQAIAADIRKAHEEGARLVVACSALKRAYRDVLRTGGPVRFVHLAGTHEAIAQRIAARRDHYMPPSLLPSQLAILEPPGTDEDALIVDIGPPPEVIAERVVADLIVDGASAAPAAT
jgi:gluconokinase